MFRPVRSWLVALTVIVAWGLVLAQSPAALPPAARTAALADKVPLDPDLTTGTLPNGLRYYVLANKTPAKRADLRLVVRAGSVLENDDERGVAHFVEHMAFEGTEHFPHQAVLAFLSSLGIGLGADANANTGFDETTYALRVPTDQLSVVDRTLLVLEDWAHNVSFEPAGVTHEQSVILEEWRQRRGVGARMQDLEFPILYRGSRYADRMPIGKPEIIQAMDVARLKKFYTDWYRPDLMAVIAVGDFDKTAVENLIKAHFAPIPGPPSPRPRPVAAVPDRPGTVYSVFTDPEAPSASVDIETLVAPRVQTTIGGYRQMLVDRLFASMLTARFAELAQQADAPFVGAAAQRGVALAQGRDHTTLTALVKEDAIERGFGVLMREVARVSKFGFTQPELDRERQTALRGFERVIAERPTRDSDSKADEYQRNFKDDEALPSLEYEYELQKRFQPSITLAEVNALAKEWFPDRNRVVIVSAPAKNGLVVPDEAKLAAVAAAVGREELTPRRETAATMPLLAALPAAGAIVKTTAPASGMTEWELSNGAKVVVKPTTIKADEILFRATRPGGTSLASDEDFPSASAAAQIVGDGGLGSLGAIDLRNALTGKVAAATPFFSEVDEGLAGGASPQDLESMFQLIYLRFTQPRADAARFAALKAQTKSLLANQAASPEFQFRSAMANAINQGSPRRRGLVAADVDAWSLDKALEFYRARFADASGFTFVFVGSIDPAVLRPLVERYLASLPASHRAETWKDLGIRPPTGVVEQKVAKGVEPKSQVAITFTGPFSYDPPHVAALRALGLQLQSRLFATIRGELGGTYTISVSQSAQKIPAPLYEVRIEFTCDPARVDDLVARVFGEIEFLKTTRIADGSMGVVREALLREFQTNSQQNSYVLSQIAQGYLTGENVADVLTLDQQFERLDAAGLTDAARVYLNANNYVKVTLVPAAK